jgi:RNA recognition motif-containing protein
VKAVAGKRVEKEPKLAKGGEDEDDSDEDKSEENGKSGGAAILDKEDESEDEKEEAKAEPKKEKTEFGRDRKEPDAKEIFVGNLSFTATESEMTTFFSKYGKVASVTILKRVICG